MTSGKVGSTGSSLPQLIIHSNPQRIWNKLVKVLNNLSGGWGGVQNVFVGGCDYGIQSGLEIPRRAKLGISFFSHKM